MSRLKVLFGSTTRALALALVALAAAAPGPAFADLGDTLGSDSLIPPDTLPGLLNPDEGDDGQGGLDLGELLPPALGGGAPSTPTKTTPEEVQAPKQDPAASRPAPAAPTTKTKAPATRIADAAVIRRNGDAASSTPSSRTRRPAQRTRFDASAFHRGEGGEVVSQPAPSPAAARRSLVGRVINRIPPEYRIAVVGLAILCMLFALVSLRERRRSLRVERQAMVDTLTELPNRQAFERRLAREWKRSERYERELGVLMLDLDDFKQINDGQGHAAGDQVLTEAATLISDRVRGSDFAARWGGDEFVVLCPETNGEGLKVLARSLEDRLAHASIRSSVGFAQREPGDLGPADLLARADASMYRRKERSRSRPERRAVAPKNSGSSLPALSAD